MAANMGRFRVGRMEPVPPHGRLLSICGYGPSLADTWRGLEGDVMSCSGAHDYLIDRSIVPMWHVEFDPRSHKTAFVSRPLPAVTYCIASTCHPSMFERLRRSRVLMWHAFTDEDTAGEVEMVKRFQPDGRLLAGGTNVGMRALIVGLELGYRRFHLHGFDCCYRGETQWAGRHTGARHYTSRVSVDGREFLTSDTMMNSTDDFFAIVLPRVIAARNESGHKCSGRPVEIHGDGLLAARLTIFERDPRLALSPQWWTPLDDTLRRAA